MLNVVVAGLKPRAAGSGTENHLLQAETGPASPLANIHLLIVAF